MRRRLTGTARVNKFRSFLATADGKAVVGCVALAFAVAIIAAAATVSSERWNVSALIHVSRDDAIAPTARATNKKFVLMSPPAHYDGTYYYAMARDPLALSDEHKQIDLPAYRYGHPGYAWLAWLVSAGRPNQVPAALLQINLIAIGIAAAAMSLLMLRLGRSPWWGLLVALNPGLIDAVTLDTTEVVGAAGLLGVLLAWAHDRRGPALAGMAALCFVKEWFVVVPLGLALWEVIRMRRLNRLPWLALTPLPFAAWWTYVAIHFHRLPSHTGLKLVEPPFAGWFNTFSRSAAAAIRPDPLQSQLGAGMIPLLAVAAGLLIAAALFALRARTFVDVVYLLFVPFVAVMTWYALEFPKDMLRELAIPSLLAGVVLATRLNGEIAGGRLELPTSRL